MTKRIEKEPQQVVDPRRPSYHPPVSPRGLLASSAAGVAAVAVAIATVAVAVPSRSDSGVAKQRRPVVSEPEVVRPATVPSEGAALPRPSERDSPGRHSSSLGSAGPAPLRGTGVERSAPAVEPIAPTPASFRPLTPALVEHLRAIRARVPDRDDRVFIKLGDSSTVSRLYLHCLGEEGVDLTGHDELADSLAFFRSGRAGRLDPFRRESRAAGVGWSINRAIGSALRQEIGEADPRFATILFGTNDVGGEAPWKYWARMRVVLTQLEEAGVIPVLSTIPPRTSREANEWVRRYNLVVEAFARDRRLPMHDLYADLAPLPDQGVSDDGVHSTVEFSGRMPDACRFDASGLRFGFNVRNLRTLELLDRLRLTVVEERAAPDRDPPPAHRGNGTGAQPVELLSLPIAIGRAWPDASGEAHHTFELTERARVWVAAGSTDGHPIPVRIERDGAEPLERRRWIDEVLPAGRYRVIVRARDPGDEYVLIVDRS